MTDIPRPEAIEASSRQELWSERNVQLQPRAGRTGNKFSITSLLPVPPLVNPIRNQEAGCLRDVVPNSQPPWAKNGCGEQTGNALLHRPCHEPRFTARIRNLPRSHRAQLHHTEPPSPGANLWRRSRDRWGCYNRHFFPKKKYS